MDRLSGLFRLLRRGQSYRNHPRGQTFPKRRGAAAVEFAIVAPLFVMFLFGIIEFGRLLMVQQLLTNASREGARRAVLDGATTTEVQTVVDQYLSGSSVTGTTIQVSPDPLSSAAFGDPVTVAVSIPFGSVSWLPAPYFVNRNTALSATTTMRRETTQ